MQINGAASAWIVADVCAHGSTERETIDLVRRAAAAGADAVTVRLSPGPLDMYGVLAVRRAALDGRVVFVPACSDAADVAQAVVLGAPVIKLLPEAVADEGALRAAARAERPMWVFTQGLSAAEVQRAMARLERLRLVAVGTAPLSGLGASISWGHAAHDGDALRARAAVSRGAIVIERPIVADPASCRARGGPCADGGAFETLVRAVRSEESRRRERVGGSSAT